MEAVGKRKHQKLRGTSELSQLILRVQIARAGGVSDGFFAARPSPALPARTRILRCDKTLTLEVRHVRWVEQREAHHAVAGTGGPRFARPTLQNTQNAFSQANSGWWKTSRASCANVIASLARAWGGDHVTGDSAKYSES